MTSSFAVTRTAALTLLLAVAPSLVSAQDPPPPTWTGNIGAGIAFTTGNTDTSNMNLSFKVVRDPKTATVFSADGLYLRGSANDVKSADSTLLNTRLQRTLSGRAFVFGQVQYLRDSFKAVDYFLAPTVGAGIKFYDTEQGSFTADASLGAAWEKYPDVTVRSNPVVAFGEKLTHKLSKTSTFTHAFGGTVIADDWSDGLYTAAFGIAAAITPRTQLKVEILDTYKSKPPVKGLKKNDLSTIAAVVYSF